MSKKILVTGGAGYIGSHVVKTLGRQGFDIVVVDNLSTGNKDSVKFGELIIGDLADRNFLEDLFSKYQFEAILHFAGSIKVPESVADPIKYYQNNSINSANLIWAANKYKVNKFIFSSTAAVYGVPPEGIAIEDVLPNPINPYGRTKLFTEMMLKDLSDSDPNFNYVALRYFNVSGADPELEIGQAFPEPFHLINIASEVASGKRDLFKIFGNDYNTPDGTCIRDYIHVADLANAHLLSLKYLLDGNKSEIFNCGYGRGFSVKEVIDIYQEVTDIKFKIKTEARREGDPDILISNADKIKKELNWTPQFNDLKVIIKSAFAWESSDTLEHWRNLKGS